MSKTSLPSNRENEVCLEKKLSYFIVCLFVKCHTRGFLSIFSQAYHYDVSRGRYFSTLNGVMKSASVAKTSCRLRCSEDMLFRKFSI